jgi:steroid delta-isomerase-like uncharacterized protein
MNSVETVQAFFAAYNAHDVAAMLKFCSPTSTFRYVPLGENGVGSIHNVAATIWQMYIDAIPDFTVKIVNVIEGVDGTIACETLNSGTPIKDIGNIKNKGRSLSTPHLFIFTFNSDGLIENITAFWDNDTIYAQLGHTEQHE